MMKPAMRNVLIFTAVILAAMILCAVAAAEAGTDGDGDKAGAAAQAKIDPPQLSKTSGFYPESFSLTMSADPGCEIFYTLDGSDPDPAAAQDEDTRAEGDANGQASAGALPRGTFRYKAPLRISDASAQPNVYSMRTDTSTGFYEDAIRRYSVIGSPDYAPPEKKIDKCTILRAVAADENGALSKETEATYFIGKAAAGYAPCRVISIVTDPDNLFDPDRGIYVTGKKFENYLIRKRTRWSKWDANYHETGKDSERPARFTLFDPDGTPVSEKTCAIRIHGNVTRAYNQKSFSVFFQDANGMPEKLGTDLFGTGYDPEELILSNGGQNNATKCNNVLVARALGDEIPQKHYEPAALFLDGEYWGFYWITERYDPDWIAYYYEVAADDLVAVKFDIDPFYAIRSEDPLTREEESNCFEEAEQFFVESDLSDPAAYAKAGQILDLDNFIDYYAVETYLGNTDWPRRNKEFWRTWQRGSGACSDGRWRALLFDFDLALEPKDRTLQTLLEKDDIFAALWENAGFRRQFEERILSLADHEFSPDSMNPIIDAYTEEYGGALERSWNRFFRAGVFTPEIFRDEMNVRKQFFKQRKTIVTKWFK